MTNMVLVGAERAFGAEIAAALAAAGYAAGDGALDVLVVNVPVVVGAVRFADVSDADLADTLETMVFGVVEAVQAALPRMATGGRIVVVAARGHLGAWGGAHLMAGNAALIGLMRSMALEFSERGIRVNALAPDFVGQRWDTPAARAEVAEAVVFLARADMHMLTGQTLLLDAARSMRMVESRRQ